MSDLYDLVRSFKHAVAVPGTFERLFPETTDADMASVLADAVAEAQLDGFLKHHLLDVDLGAVVPDLIPAEQALVVIFAAHRFVRTELMNHKTHVHYEAAGAVFEEAEGARLLEALFDDVRERKQHLIDRIEREGLATGVTVIDAYAARLSVETSHGWV